MKIVLAGEKVTNDEYRFRQLKFFYEMPSILYVDFHIQIIQLVMTQAHAKSNWRVCQHTIPVIMVKKN